MTSPDPVRSADVHGPQRRALSVLAGITVLGLGIVATVFGAWMLQHSLRTEWVFGSPPVLFLLLTIVGILTSLGGWRMIFRPGRS